MKNIICFDGSYMMHRAVSAVGAAFTERLGADRASVAQCLSNNLYADVARFGVGADGIAIAMDRKSWRREIGDKTYKANRDAKESPVDWAEAKKLFSEWAEAASKMYGIPHISHEGAEGDDVIFALSKACSDAGCGCIVFCTDGDLSQLAHGGTVVFRNVKSKASPNGELRVPQELWDSFNRNDIFAPPPPARLRALFEGRAEGNGVVTANHLSELFCKLFMGDAKDNVPELFKWECQTSTGAPRYWHITEKHISEALEAIGLSLSAIRWEHFYDLSILSHVAKYIAAKFAYILPSEILETGFCKTCAEIFGMFLLPNGEFGKALLQKYSVKKNRKELFKGAPAAILEMLDNPDNSKAGYEAIYKKCCLHYEIIKNAAEVENENFLLDSYLERIILNRRFKALNESEIPEAVFKGAYLKASEAVPMALKSHGQAMGREAARFTEGILSYMGLDTNGYFNAY